MNNSMGDIEVIRPAVFSDEDEIRAFFTLKNRSSSINKSKIKGLNLGYNTNENPEVVTENRKILLNAFGINHAWIAFANQVHSTRVQVVSTGGTYAKTDALITQVPEVALAIQVADCAALLIAEPFSRIIAAVHAGWRGAADDIVPNTIKKMKEMGAEMSGAKAFISPCICKKHFEVGQKVTGKFPDAFIDYKNYEKPHINLKKFLNHQLIEEGMQAGNIEVHPGCTVNAKEQYYSYRREQEKSGRMMAVIEMKLSKSSTFDL